MKPTRYETDRARQQQAALTSQYRAIGPAAIAAALLHTAKKKPQTKPA